MTQTNQGSPVLHSPRRFLVTGAKGFIGAWIVKELVDRGDRPFVFDIDTGSARLAALLTPEQIASVQFLQGDITQFKDVDGAIADNGVTHVLHLAGIQVPFCAADPLLGAMINVVGTLNVFEVAKRRRDQVKSIVYASSVAVFGPEEAYGSVTIPEGAPLLPGTHYGVYKQCNEGNARVYFLNDGLSERRASPRHGLRRGAGPGYDLRTHQSHKSGHCRPTLLHSLHRGTDLQYVRDTARIFIRCAEAGLTGAKVYTPRGAVMQVHEFLTVLNQIVPVSQTLIKAEGKSLPVSYDFDDSALRHDLPGLACTPLADGIRETAAIFERLKLAGTLDLKDLET